MRSVALHCMRNSDSLHITRPLCRHMAAGSSMRAAATSILQAWYAFQIVFWAPDNDVLGHPYVKAFLFDCEGLQMYQVLTYLSLIVQAVFCAHHMMCLQSMIVLVALS